MDKIQRRRRTKSGEAAPPPADTPPGKKRYNLRSKKSDEVQWIDDDTLQIKSEEEEDDAPARPTKKPRVEVDSDEESEQTVHGITLPKDVPVSVKIHIHTNVEVGDEDEDDDETYEDDDDDDDEDDENEDEDEDEDEDEEDAEDESLTESDIAQLLARELGSAYGRQRRPEPVFIITGAGTPINRKKEKSALEPAIKLFRKEREYFDELPKSKAKKFVKIMKDIDHQLGETEVPFKFRAMELDCDDATKAAIIRKIDNMNRMGMESGEAQKLRTWVEAILRVPFGKIVPLPASMDSGADFLREARQKMDKATYGMEPAKMQIMQTLAKWISNPESVGNCIAMRGPPGVGKTAFARNGIAEVLNRPFMFFSLGGASDIAHYTGHSYTYEGSMWGRIIDAIIQAKCMNPVLYFDELDKISTTPHGEEITSMLIHLTDRSQNSQYHDRYFAGIDFDLSKCMFVFSYNDESKISPILKDRMTVIHCSGYKDPEKKVIIANYVWPEILNHVGIDRADLQPTEEAAEYIIKEFSEGEEGMRTLIRVVEAVVSRINLLRISDPETAAKYKFAVPVEFPMKLDVPTVQKLLCDFSPKESEPWRSLYN